MTPLDIVNGGAGADTLNLNVLNGVGAVGVAVTALPVISIAGVETVNARAAVGLTADTTTWTGLTALNLTQGSAVTLTAAATTGINVSGATGAITVDGGKDVTVTDGTAGKSITIGDTTVNAGTVTVTDSNVGAASIKVDGGTNVTINAVGSTGSTEVISVGQGVASTDLPSGVVSVTSSSLANATDSATLNAIKVTGGTTVTVTQIASSTAAATDTNAATITQGAVTVTAGAATTEVTVLQTRSTAGVNAVTAVAGVTETASVKFSALNSGQTVIIGGDGDNLLEVGELAFTAAKSLSAAEVATAFSNLIAGDTQSSGIVANGVYTGDITGWTSGAAVGDTVVFTSTVAGDPANLAFTGAGTHTVTTTQGVTAVNAVTGVLGVQTGTVTINDNATASIKTITLDGYGATQIGNVGNVTKLETLNLANSGSTGAAGETDAAVTANVGATLSTLNLGLNNVQGAVTLTGAGLKVLNVTTSGANSSTALAAAAVETLTIAGDKSVNLATGTFTALKSITVSGSAGAVFDGDEADTVTSVNTTGTTGTVTASINGQTATYTGGAGVDNVTLTTTAPTKAISTGAGNDRVTLANGTTAMGANGSINAGDGSADTLVIVAADAVTASGGTTFATKVTGFERLEVTGATGPQAIDTAALGNYNDVTVSTATASTGLTLNNLTSGATIRLNDGSNVSTAAAIKDAATGTADVLNIVVTDGARGGAANNNGTIVAAEVETINITTVDGTTETPTNLVADQQNLTLQATKATKIVITGEIGDRPRFP